MSSWTDTFKFDVLHFIQKTESGKTQSTRYNTLNLSPLSCSSDDLTAENGGENSKAVSSSAVELRSFDGYIIPHRSLSDTELNCFP